MKRKFEVEFLDEAIDFIESLDLKEREKILYNARKSQLVNDPELFKKLNDSIWEFRTKFRKNHYRLLAFWDKTSKEDTLVIATNGFIKKTQKTPKAEIERAEKIKKEYFTIKSRNNEKE